MPRWGKGEGPERVTGLRLWDEEVGGAGKRAGESGGRTGEGVGSDFNRVSLGWEPQGALCPGQFKMGVWPSRSMVAARGRREGRGELLSNGYRVLVLQDEKGSGDGGDVGTQGEVNLMLLNCKCSNG